LFQIGTLDSVSVEVLRDKWQGICLDEDALNEMLKLGGFTENVDWLKFIAIAAGHLTNVSHINFQDLLSLQKGSPIILLINTNNQSLCALFHCAFIYS
jgi:hypothetical protein